MLDKLHLDTTEALFLFGAVLLTIPMAWLFIKAGRELMKEPPATPAPQDQRNDA